MLGTSQGAPSTIRCIKTCPLRHPEEPVGQPVREHPAPSGALRPRPLRAGPLLSSHQGAPSTIRCIETGNSPGWRRSTARVREHPAPLGALRQPSGALRVQRDVHRQGAPSTIRCIKTWRCSRRRGCRSRTVREQPAPPCSSDRAPESGPGQRQLCAGGAPCAATIQGGRGSLAAPIGCCTGGGRGCLSH